MTSKLPFPLSAADAGRRSELKLTVETASTAARLTASRVRCERRALCMSDCDVRRKGDLVLSLMFGLSLGKGAPLAVVLRSS